MVDAVVAELSPVIAGLADIDGAETAVASPGSAPDEARVQADLARLKTLLENGDSEAVDCVESLLQQAGGSALAAGLRGIAHAIADYDFDTGLARLDELLAAGSR